MEFPLQRENGTPGGADTPRLLISFLFPSYSYLPRARDCLEAIFLGKNPRPTTRILRSDDAPRMELFRIARWISAVSLKA